MRIALLVTTIVLTSVASHAQEFVPPVFLSPRFVASVNAPSSIVITGNEEPGERLIVTGRVTSGGKRWHASPSTHFTPMPRVCTRKTGATAMKTRGCTAPCALMLTADIVTRRSDLEVMAITRHTCTTW